MLCSSPIAARGPRRRCPSSRRDPHPAPAGSRGSGAAPLAARLLLPGPSSGPGTPAAPSGEPVLPGRGARGTGPGPLLLLLVLPRGRAPPRGRRGPLSPGASARPTCRSGRRRGRRAPRAGHRGLEEAASAPRHRRSPLRATRDGRPEGGVRGLEACGTGARTARCSLDASEPPGSRGPRRGARPPRLPSHLAPSSRPLTPPLGAHLPTRTHARRHTRAHTRAPRVGVIGAAMRSGAPSSHSASAKPFLPPGSCPGGRAASRTSYKRTLYSGLDRTHTEDLLSLASLGFIPF